MKLLLDAGADAGLGEHSEQPPLLIAEEWADIETVRLLLDHGADANVQSSDGTTALRMSIGTADEEMVKLLLDHKARVQMQKDPKGLNDLDAAREQASLLRDYGSHYAKILTLLKNASNASER